MESITEFIGLDVSDRSSAVCIVDAAGEELERRSIATTQAGLERCFKPMPRARIVLEAGTHSPWISVALIAMGHEVIVANPRKLEMISKSHKKTDRQDAAILAELARTHSKLLQPVQHKGPQARRDLSVLHARDALLAARTLIVNHIRGVTKSWGGRLKKCDPASIHKLEDSLPEELQPILSAALQMCRHLTAAIRGYDQEISRTFVNRALPVGMTQIDGVGEQTLVAYQASIEDPHRFAKVRQVSGYFGLVPRLDESGDSKPQLGISKAGSATMRRLLVNCAHYILGPLGPECDLRDWGLKLVTRGGRGAKKRAAVALASKLARVLLALWKSGERYDPFRQRRRKGLDISEVDSNEMTKKRTRVPRVLRETVA